MKIAVMGTGGMGGYYGGLLAAVGEDVSFIARGEHLNALKSDGLLLKGDGDVATSEYTICVFLVSIGFGVKYCLIYAGTPLLDEQSSAFPIIFL